jgi:colicin import membrane protein
MTAAPQRGRRRAESVRRQSLFGLGSARISRTGTHAAGSASSAVTKTAKCMAAVAVVGGLLTAGAIAQQVGHTTDPSLASSAETSAATTSVTASDDATISFPGLSVTSDAKASASASTDVKAAAAEVTPVPAKASPAPAVAVDDPAAAKAYAATQVSARGWGAGEMSCLTQLWERESNWRTTAMNPDGGAYGIVQSLPAEKMASVGADYLTNYETQIKWGLNYITETYSTPCGAWAHSNAVNWY